MHLFQCVESLEKYFFFVSIAKYSDRCFCYFTAAMFVSLQTAQTWRLHTKKFYKYGWHTSANNARMKNSRDLILEEVVYIPVIDFIHWMVMIFSFDHMTDENRELTLSFPCCLSLASFVFLWWRFSVVFMILKLARVLWMCTPWCFLVSLSSLSSLCSVGLRSLLRR